jgi:K+/H+ antiporter YhaU regulatory subunit KhtT
VRSRTGATILAVRRAATGVFDTNPAPDSYLNTGDRIIAIGTPAQITKLEELLAASARVDS